VDGIRGCPTRFFLFIIPSEVGYAPAAAAPLSWQLGRGQHDQICTDDNKQEYAAQQVSAFAHITQSPHRHDGG